VGGGYNQTLFSFLFVENNNNKRHSSINGGTNTQRHTKKKKTNLVKYIFKKTGIRRRELGVHFS
jgi:hypothetical protein